MKGFIKKTAAFTCFGAAVFAILGCEHYRNLVDPCWPERYNFTARQSVREMHNAQAAQGHMLDQTIWNYHFKADDKGNATAILNEGGEDYLRGLARRQPNPDYNLWLQYAHDVKDAGQRNLIMEQRKTAIKNFLTTHTMVGNGSSYQINVHDFLPPTYPAEWSTNAVKGMADLTNPPKQFPFQEKKAGGSGGSSGGGGN